MKLIDADAFERAMYEEAFEKDSDMQRWDSGCWIRYKLYERVLDAQPTIDAVPVIRCKDCKYWNGAGKFCDYEMSGLEDDYCSWAEPKVTE